MKSQKLVGIIGMALVALFWGLSFVSIQVVGTTIGPFSFTTARFLIAAVACGLFYVIISKKNGKFEKIEKEDWKKVAMNAILGIAIYYPLSTWAITQIPASAASVLSAIQPILMIIFEFIFLHVAITKKNLLAVSISVLGAILVVGKISLSGGSSDGFVQLLGYLGQFFATCLWCLYTVLQNPLNKKYSVITLNTYQFAIGSILMLPSFFIENNQWGAMTGSQWFNLIYLGVVCSGLCFILYNLAIPRIGATTSSLFLNAGPIITMISAIIMFGEYPTVIKVIGVILTVIGVTIASVDFKKTKK